MLLQGLCYELGKQHHCSVVAVLEYLALQDLRRERRLHHPSCSSCFVNGGVDVSTDGEVDDLM